MKRSHLHQGDVLLSIVGSVGETSLVKTDQEATCSCKLAILRPHSIAPEYLAVFLSSPIGRLLSDRWKRGTVQNGLLLEDLDQVPVARFSTRFETAVVGAVQIAYRKQKQAGLHLKRAERTLSHVLGLDGWEPLEALSYVQSSREVLATGRLDAEYFHPAKSQALAKLAAMSDHTVGDFFQSIHDLWRPTNSKPSELVRNYDLTDALDPFLDSDKPAITHKEIASTKKIVVAGDLVASRLRSYLREIAVVLPGGSTPTVVSTEFIVLRPRSTVSNFLAVEALLVYLRSRLPQIVFTWSQDGSNHPRFDEQELLDLPVPLQLIEEQDKYVVAIQKLIAQRRDAANLLNIAKRAVEIAVEESEAKAMAVLDRLESQILVELEAQQE